MASASNIRAGRAFVELGSTDVNFNKGLDKALRRIQTFGRSVATIGQRVVQGGIFAATPFALAGKSFASYEQAMARVKAITNATGDQFSALGNLAKKLGRDTQFSAADAAKAMGNFAQAGFSVNEILKATGPTLDLAATAQIGIAEAGDIAAKILRGMGLDVSQLSGVIDVLAKAATTSNTDIVMLGDAFKFVGPVAKSAGVSLEEITAAIQLLSNAGIQGELAGTSLRGILLSLTSPSEKAEKELAKLGIRIKDGKGDFVGLISVVGQLQKALAGMGNAQRLEILGHIFPDRQAAGAMELVAQGADHLASATKALGGAAGTAARVAAVQLDTMSGAAEMVMSSLEGLGLEVGEALNPVLRKAATFLVDLLNALAATAKASPDLIIGMAKTVAVSIAAGAAIAGLGVALSTAGAALAVILSPLGIIATALGAGVAAWAKWTEGGQLAIAGFLPLLDSMKETATTTFKAISDALKGGDLALAGKVLWAGLRVEFLKGKNYVMDVFSEIAMFAKNTWSDISPEFDKTLVNAFFGILHTWVDVSDAMVTTFNQALEEMAKNVVAMFVGPIGEALGAALGVDLVTPLKNVGVLESDEKKAFREDRRQTRHEQLNQDNQGILNDIDAEEQDNARRHAEERAFDPGIEQRRTDLQKAQDELNALTQEAAKEASRVTSSTGPTTTFPSQPRSPGELPDVEENVRAAVRKGESIGTFNASAVSRLGAGKSLTSLMENQIKATESVEKQLAKLNEKARRGLAFG